MSFGTYRLRVLALVAIGVVAVAPATGAFADHIQTGNANENASCMGHEASAVSPPSVGGNGHTEGMPEELEFWDNVAIPFYGLKNRGSVASILGKLHLPSHSACDGFFGLPE